MDSLKRWLKMYCQECGAKIENGKFCKECGTKIEVIDEIGIINSPEPKISTSEMILLILAIIFIFPMGFHMLPAMAAKITREKREWREEREMNIRILQ